MSSRRAYIDWLRGFAVLVMIEWHAIDAWTLDTERAGPFFKTLVFFGGWAAPLFLFLAGVAIPFAVQSHIRKGRTIREAAWALQKRGWQIWLLAHLFRFQMYILNPQAVWHSILKPDILNILGLGMVFAAFCWGRATTMRARIAWLLGPALLVLVIAPLARTWWWPTLLHPRFEAYIRPNGPFGVFTLFPWVAFVLVGAAIGVWIARTRGAAEDRRFHARLAGAGMAVAAAGYVGMWLPTPLETSFWTTSWSYFLMRTGAMIVALAIAWLWMARPSAGRWSPMVLFGQTSLFVYWVHVELAYGMFSLPLRKSLALREAFAAYAVLTGVMLVMAAWWKRRETRPWVPGHLVAPATALIVLAASGIVPAAAQDQWRPVVARLPAGIPVSAVAACVTDEGAVPFRVSEVAPGAADAQCGVTAIARCSIPRTEPLDVDVGALCRGGMARVVPAVRTLAPTWPAPDRITVEWRAWDGSISALLATRVVDPVAGEALPLASDVRLLRIVRAGASPVTLIAPVADDTAQNLSAEVPPSSTGGELFLFLDARERAFPTLTIRGPETIVVGIAGAPFHSLPGLQPGDYTLRFGTDNAPEGPPIVFRIMEGGTTEFVPRLPATFNERRISGHVTFNGAPLPRQPLHIIHTRTDRTLTVSTDDEGRYAVTVEEDGMYVVRAVAAHDFGHLEARGQVALGETRLDLDLAGAAVRLQFLMRGAVPAGPVEFVLAAVDGPQRFRADVTDFSQPTDLVAIPFGTYTARASAAPNFVAGGVPVVIDGTPGVRSLVLDLQEQQATLRVVNDGTGGAVTGARARSDQQILRPLLAGAFDVQRLPPGAPIIVRAPGHVSACVVLAPDTENLVRLRSDTAALQFRVEGQNLRVPPGRLRLTAADPCAIPLAEFDWRRVEGGFEVTNLPNNVPFLFELGTRTLTLRAPGDAVILK